MLSILGAEQSELAKSRCQIKITLAAAQDLFPMAKILPFNANVRDRCLGDSHNTTASDLSTPFYNASIQADCGSLPLLKMLHHASTKSEGFKDACLLGSIWLRQRGIGSSISNGGFGQFEWASILASLLRGGLEETPRLPSSSTGAQLFKAMINFIANRDLAVKHWDPGSLMRDLSSTGEPFFINSDCGVNILFKTTSWWYQLIRHEAKQSITSLNQTASDCFNDVFIVKVKEPIYRFDTVFSIPIPSSSRSTSKPSMAGFSDLQKYCDKVHDVISKALTDRLSLLSIGTPSTPTWPVKSHRSKALSRENLVLGIKQNPGGSFRTVDYGPAADEKEAGASFRAFWGEKAELRRFKDGRILECVAWPSDDETPILDQIVEYAAVRHLGVNGTHNASSAAKYLLKKLGSAQMDSVISVAPFQSVYTAFEELEMTIRNLEGLPLQVRQVSGHSPFLRNASVSLPKQSGLDHPVDVCIQLEGSARWPNDFGAVQRTKIAFLLKLGELLKEAKPRSEPRVGLENEGSKTLNIAFLEVRSQSGYQFHLRIFLEREMSILQMSLKDKNFELGRREELTSALATYKRLFVQGPLHTQAVRRLCTQFPLLSPCMRLLKVWRDSHLLSPHISDELLELLAIQVFVRPQPWSPPGNITAGFFRTLYFISKWDWRSTPLIVDFSSDMTKEGYEEIQTRFDAWKEIDPGMNRMVMFAASSMASDGLTWTETGPSLVCAARFTELAKAACALMETDRMDVDVASLFTSPTTAFDFLLHIHPQHSGAQGKERKQSAFKNMMLEADETASTMPVQMFVEELRSLYGRDVIFFYDEQKLDVIGGLWNPQTMSRSWKVNLGYSSACHASTTGDGVDATLNQPATLNDIARLGGAMIASVEVH